MDAQPQAPSTPLRRFFPAAAGGFLLRLALWFPALLLLWLPLGALYRTTLLTAGNAAFGVVGAGMEVRFLHYTRWAEVGVTDTADMAVLLRKPAWHDERGQQQHVLAKAVCTFYQPFTALTFLFALLLASRISWRECWWQAAAGVAALHFAMLAAVAIDVCHAVHSRAPPLGSDDWWRTIIAMLHFSVTDWPAGVFIVPLLLWTFLCWSRSGLQRSD